VDWFLCRLVQELSETMCCRKRDSCCCELPCLALVRTHLLVAPDSCSDERITKPRVPVFRASQPAAQRKARLPKGLRVFSSFLHLHALSLLVEARHPPALAAQPDVLAAIKRQEVVGSQVRLPGPGAIKGAIGRGAM
jgi:hypothetical protein